MIYMGVSYINNNLYDWFDKKKHFKNGIIIHKTF